MKSLWSTLRETFAAWNEHEAPRLGAALAFYTILSMAPLVLLAIALVALVFGRSTAQDQIMGQVQGMIGTDGAGAVRSMLEQAQKPAPGIVASLVSLATLLFGASGVCGELRSALNKIWDVKPTGEEGIAGMIKQRFFSLAMVLAIGFLLLVSLLLSAGLAAFGKAWSGVVPVPEFWLGALNFVVSFVGVSVLFGLIFKYVPETKVHWKDVWRGALATGLLFTVGKFLIGLYLGKASVGSAYGAAGSLIVVIVWIYYSSMIVFFGAEFTYVLMRAEHPEAA